MKNAKVFYMCFTAENTLMLAGEVEKGLNYQSSAGWFIPVEISEEKNDALIFSDDYDFNVLHNGIESVLKLKKTVLSEKKIPNAITDAPSYPLPVFAMETAIGKFLFRVSRYLVPYTGNFNSIKSLKNRRFIRLIPTQGEMHLEKVFKEHRFLFLGTPNSD